MDILSIAPMILIAVIFWFLLIRPQMKRQKEHTAMVMAVARGDMVTTGGGLIGKVVRVQEHEVEVELAKGVVVKALKTTLSAVDPKNKPTPVVKKK